MPLTTEPPSSVLMIGGPKRQPDIDADAPEKHEVIGRTSLVNSDDLAPAFAEAAEMLADVTPPPGFRRLPVATVFGIVRDIQLKRGCVAVGDEVVVDLCYRPGWTYIAALQSLDGLWKDHDRDVDRSTLVTIALRPLPPARMTRMGYELPSLEDARRMAIEDCRELCMWHYDPGTMRTWKAGTPYPDPVTEDDPAAWEALSARARRTIARELRHIIDNTPPSFLQLSPTWSFTVDGVTMGWASPLNLTDAAPSGDKCVRVRVGLDSDPADIDGFLDRIRVKSNGTVVVLQDGEVVTP